jgi:hypothetical protein
LVEPQPGRRDSVATARFGDASTTNAHAARQRARSELTSSGRARAVSPDRAYRRVAPTSGRGPNRSCHLEQERRVVPPGTIASRSHRLATGRPIQPTNAALPKARVPSTIRLPTTPPTRFAAPSTSAVTVARTSSGKSDSRIHCAGS